MTINKTKHIVVIGGGFAGLNFIKKIAKENAYTVTLVDKNNYNQFTPLVYQVATGFLEPSNISYPFRKFLRSRKRVNFHLGELIKISPEDHLAYFDNTVLPYDYLVLAFGSVSNFYGNGGLALRSIPMKSMTDALNMRNTLLRSLEEASGTTDETRRKALLTIVVAGGGPTGVEISGMLGEMREKIIRKDYPELHTAMGDIYVIDGGKTLLNQMSLQSQQYATRMLEKRGIKIILNTFITGFEKEEVTLSNGMVIITSNLIWAAGVTCFPIEGIPQINYGSNQRLLVDRYNRLCAVPDIYAIGDSCLESTDARYVKGHPQLAQPAIQQGAHLAKNFISLAKNRSLKPFVYRDKGVMAIIGKSSAVVDLTQPRIFLSGVTALLIWLLIHIHSLIAYDNKLKTLFNWIVTYLTGDQSLRMVYDVKKKSDL